jgi:hypothetical protein
VHLSSVYREIKDAKPLQITNGPFGSTGTWWRSWVEH